MSQLSATVRLRPLRFAFLVRPDDSKRVHQILTINTCLWGGKFNPIIPFLRRVPVWWDRRHRFETGKQIVNGYLDRYEPDFLVEAEKGLADGLGFDPKRIIQMSEVLARDSDIDHEGNGQSTFDLYKSLYIKEFQFERRSEHRIKSVIPEDPKFSAFCACTFGGFPRQKGLGYFERAFNDAFDPTEVALNGAALAQLYQSRFTSALDLGHENIDIDYNDHSDPTLFILDAQAPRDLIDFWNLRTMQREVLAVPLQWLGELSAFCRDAIKTAHRPMPGNPHGVMLRARVLFSRSVPTPEIQDLYEQHLAVDIPGGNVLHDWYPTIWRENPRYVVRSSRPTLTAAEKTFDVQYSEETPDVRFDSLHPTFAERFGNNNRWANVIKLRDFSFENRIATSLPTDYRNPRFSPFSVGSGVLPTMEGLVLFPRFRDTQHYLSLSDGVTAIAKWLKTFAIDVRLSDAGRATQQVVQTLGGFNGVRSIANAGVVNLLNDISRKPNSKSMKQKEFINKVQDAVNGNLWLEGAAEKLITKNALELGLELKCSKCASWSWYALKQLDYKVRCSLCLRDSGFPIIDPGGAESSRWAYRLIGPFALPDFANGGYAAALSIRFFADVIGLDGINVTWSAGQELSFQSGKKIEADFILWYQRTRMFGTDSPTEVVFGEVKSFGREVLASSGGPRRKAKKEDVFKDADIARMKLLAESFPGAVLVFATMNDAGALTKDEVSRLRKLAEWGRGYVMESRRTRAPVIVLTGTELFAGYSLQEAWENKGGRHKELSSPGYVELDHLQTLADMTQQLYLGMPPYSEWAEAKWKARRARKQKGG